MNFKVLVLPELFTKLPLEVKENIKSSLKELNVPFPGTGRGNKKEIKGADDVAYRLRVGSYRIFYRIDRENHRVYVFDILTAEQAHKKYGRL
ncbi:type II toxin-antitoxin system RelE family toxin [Methanolobus halotolerans]|uniref:Type II toxin-antitoxin system RelE/ParE family toxin n=1 Tax=Methanolobus halotolerans TaxID=2052935 RepID=A0A4E0PSU6_9EURY|nr:type II toxin-antitoxin system RelE/ParE family toxin [Methanolobus halotolerans]TGC06966.1 type II toxin-antitoxin system RelE/ParE family toxin [Methanolobus halotolerans]